MVVELLAHDVNLLRRYQLCQKGRVRDTARDLSNSMVDVGINPAANIDFKALLNPIKEHHLLLGHLRCMHGWHKSATNKVVLDLHVLLDVLGWEIGVLVPHYSPPSTPAFTYHIADLLHIGRVHQILHLIRATGVLRQMAELINRPRIISYLFPPYKHRIP